MSVTAIVVNYNAGEALRCCVQSVLSGTVTPRVMVVDNASTDGSADRLRGLYGNRGGVEIISNASNLGFARAVNAAAVELDSDFMLVVNPDCVLERNTLEAMLRAMEADAGAALAAPAVRDSRGRLEKSAARRFPTPWNSLVTMSGLWRLLPFLKGVPMHPRRIPRETARVEAVSGACMLIRRAVFMELGMMDEGYGLHCEDLDLMYRMRQAGWHCLYVPSGSAVHEQGVSSRSRPLWVHRQKHAGMARFFRKFQAAGYPPPVRWLVFAGIWARYLLLLPLAWLRR